MNAGMNDDELRGLLSEMRDDPVPAESMARVRMAVKEGVRARPRGFGWGWRIAALLALAGCLAAVMLRPRMVEPAEKPVAIPVAAAEPSAPVEAAPRPEVHKLVRTAAEVAKPVRRVQPAPASHPASNVEAAGGAHEIRIENPYDPDVVIVLIGG